MRNITLGELADTLRPLSTNGIIAAAQAKADRAMHLARTARAEAEAEVALLTAAEDLAHAKYLRVKNLRHARSVAMTTYLRVHTQADRVRPILLAWAKQKEIIAKYERLHLQDVIRQVSR